MFGNNYIILIIFNLYNTRITSQEIILYGSIYLQAKKALHTVLNKNKNTGQKRSILKIYITMIMAGCRLLG